MFSGSPQELGQQIVASARVPTTLVHETSGYHGHLGVSQAYTWLFNVHQPAAERLLVLFSHLIVF